MAEGKRSVTKICEECKSKYYQSAGQMTDLSPEYAHILYGYENCKHQFEKGEFLKCFGNGNNSDYINTLKKQIREVPSKTTGTGKFYRKHANRMRLYGV